jgi:protein O-mannosyl-transferase
VNAWKKNFLISLLLAAGTAALYWPVTGHGFIGFDDNEYLVQNWHIHPGVTWSGIKWAFGSGYASNWHPLTWISHMLDCQFYGLNPGGHHLTNLILHSINSALLFILLNQMTGAMWRSAFVAALFAWHPLHVESVAWAAERKDVLSAFFWILTMMAYARYTQKKAGVAAPQQINRTGFFYYSLALVFFALALMSKPMAVTLPFVLLLMDFWPLRRVSGFEATGWEVALSEAPAVRQPRRAGVLILEKLPFFVLAAVASAITVKVQQAGGAVDSLANTSLALRLENAVIAYVSYILKTIWPTHLAVLYPLTTHLAIGLVLGSAALFVSISILAFWRAKRFPYLFSGWFWFAGTLVPVIGIVQVGAQSMADRYTYIPSIGLFIVLAWGAAELSSKILRARMVLAGGGALALVASLLLTCRQLNYWQNGETLFRHTIAVTDNNFLAYSALGASYADDGRTNEALQLSAEAVRMDPECPAAQYNLGTFLLAAGQADDAIDHFKAALKNNPRFADAENNLGKAYQAVGKLEEAAAHLTAATVLAPDDPEVFYNLGAVQLMQSKKSEAATQLARALQLNPDYADAHANLAVILMSLGHPQEATFHFAEEVRLRPNDPVARLNYGLALLDQNQPVEASHQFTEVLRVHPDSALAHYRLAVALAKLDKTQDAIAQCRESLRLQPDLPDAREALEFWTHNKN